MVADVKMVTLGQEPEPTFCSGGWGHSYLTRVRGDPRRAVEAIRQEVQSFDPALTLGDALPMERRIADIAVAERFRMLVIAAAAVMALLLATVGLSAVVAYSVNRVDTRSASASRWARSARRSRASRRGGPCGSSRPAPRSASCSSLACPDCCRASFTAWHRWTRCPSWAVSFLLGSVCLLASYVPARRAAQVDPMEVLGVE